MSGVFSMSFTPSVVCLSFGIAFLGSYLTITFCYILKLLQKGAFTLKVLNKSGVVFGMACALGGIGIWCMHFVGMSSMKLHDPSGQHVDVAYRLFPTLLSLLFVILFSGVGLYVASMDVMFGKSKEQIVEIYVKEASHLTMQEIRRTSNFKIMLIISTHSLHHLVLGGVIAGSGISVMHYLGMWGMLVNDSYIVWNIGIIAASILIAIVASIAAFWILFRFLSLYPHMEVLRIASSFIMAVAVCGMHYTGMAAATFKYEAGQTPSVIIKSLKYYVDDVDAYYVVLLTAVVLGAVLVMMAFMELRHWIFSISLELKNCTKLLEQVAGEPYSNMGSLMLTPTTTRKFLPNKSIVASQRKVVPINSPTTSVHMITSRDITGVDSQTRTQSFGAIGSTVNESLKGGENGYPLMCVEDLEV